MQVIAQRGAHSFLVRSADGWRGVIVDVEDGSVSRSLPVQSILARGYWGAVKDEQKAAQAAALVKPE